MVGKITLFDAVLVVQVKPKVVAIKRSPSPPLTNQKGKQACSLSLSRKEKKSKGSSLPSDLILGPNEVPIAEVGMKDRAPLDVARATPTIMSEALEEREKTLVILMGAWAEASEAQAQQRMP